MHGKDPGTRGGKPSAPGADKRDGKLPRIREALLADAIATSAGSDLCRIYDARCSG